MCSEWAWAEGTIDSTIHHLYRVRVRDWEASSKRKQYQIWIWGTEKANFDIRKDQRG
jgi:hypothetical protein